MKHLKNKKVRCLRRGGRNPLESGEVRPPPDRSGEPPDRNGRRELSREGLRKAPEWGQKAGLKTGKLPP
jgi:hypothetical protein